VREVLRMTTAPENDYEAQRKATAIDDLLARIGVSDANATAWWNHHAYPELGGRTPTQAWLAGDRDAVRALVDQWYQDTENALAERRRNPEFMAMLRRKLDTLNNRQRHAS
jgi:hypothetical protein